MKKELTEKERSLLDYICSKYSLDFSGCKARKTKKGHLFVEGDSYVFRIEKKHLELILDSDYRTEDVIVISVDRSSVCFKDYEEYIRKKEEDAARLRKERKAARKAEKQRQQQKREEWKERVRTEFPQNLDAVMTDMKAPFKPDGWSYKDMEFWEYYENEIQVTIAIQKDIRTMKGLKLAYISGSMTASVNPLSREAICKKVKYLMSSKKKSVCLVDEGHQFLQRQTYLFLKKFKDLSVCQEFLKVVDEADFFEYMDFLKHNHAKECQDRIRISEIQIKRGDVLKYKVFGQEFLYSIKENSVSMPNAVLSRLKKLAGFEKEYRTVIKSCLQIADKIGCPQYRVTENLDVLVRALVGKRYAEQVFSPEEFSPASLRKWYKEKAKEFEEEEKEQERQKIKRAKSLKSFGNLLASDIYDLVCLNDYITESAIVKNLRGMKQTFQATIKDVENSGKYGLLTNEEVERVYSQMKREKLISEKGIDGTYGEFYIVKPCPEGKLISEIHIEEKKEYAKFLDTDWVSYMKKVINAGKERKLTKKEDQEQMKLLEQKRVLSIYPDLVRQFLKGKPEHWKDFAFTMYSMETGIQKKYWKYVTGLFEEKKDDNK